MIYANSTMMETIYKGLLEGDETPENIDKRAQYLQEAQVKDQSINKQKIMTPIHYVTKRLRIIPWKKLTALSNSLDPLKEPESKLH